MKTIQAVIGFVVQLVWLVVFVNALVIVIGWLLGAWLPLSLGAASSLFVWLLPFAALTMFFVLLLEPFPTSYEG